MAVPSWVKLSKKPNKEPQYNVDIQLTTPTNKPSWAGVKLEPKKVPSTPSLSPPSLFKDYDVDKDTSILGKLNKLIVDPDLRREYEKIKNKDYKALRLQYGDNASLIDQLGNMNYEDYRKWKYQNDKNVKWKPSMTNQMPKMNENNPALLKTLERPFAQATNVLFGDNAIKKTSTGNKAVDVGTDIVGSIMGVAAPIPGAQTNLLSQSTKLGQVGVNKLSKYAPKLTQSKLGSRVIEGAIAGIPIDMFEGIKENDNLKDLALRAGRGALIGGALDVGIYGAGKGIGALKNKAVKETIEESTLGLNKGGKKVFKTPETVKAIKEKADLEDYLNNLEYNSLLNDLDPNYIKNENAFRGKIGAKTLNADDILTPLEVKPKTKPKIELPKLSEKTIKQVKGVPMNTLDEAAATSALKEPPKVTIPQIPQPKAKVVQLPDIGQGGKNRQFAENSMLNSDAIPESMKKQIENNMPTYEPITNKETWERASSKVNSNPDKAVREYWENPVLRGADDTALGEALIVKSIKEGNISEANRLTADLAEKLTRAGQTVQAASMMKRMTPEGFLMYAQRQVNNINKEIDLGKFGKKIGKLQLTQEDSAKIIDFMSKAQSLEGRDKDVAIAQAAKVVQDKIPSSAMQKLKGFQIISMLANPKTQVRNVLGNVIFGGAENISNIIGAGIDKGVSKFTGQRTTLLPDLKMQGESMVKGAKETLEDSKLGINTTTSNTQFDIRPGQTFKGGILGKVENITGTGLQLGDRPFYKAAYDESLRQQMKIAGITKPTQEMIEKATKLAEYRTYQDINKVTQLFQGFQKTLNKVGTEDFGLGNVVMPFPKTPANILARALDYSPAGMFKAVRAATKNGFDQKTFVDSLSRSLTGTGAILLGYKLAKNGVITGQSSKDKDLASLEKSMGKSSYAFNTTALKRLVGGKETAAQEGDVYRTYDWAQPISIPLAIGADIFLGGKDEKDAGAVAINALRSGGTTLFQQSLLQGLQRFMGGYSPVDNLLETALNTGSQFVPSLSKQATQMIDSNVRETYDPNMFRNAGNLIKSKIPGLSATLPIKYDTLGRPIKQFQGRNNPLNVMLNPGFTTNYNPTDVQKNLYDIYKQSGDASILPRVAPKSFTYKGKTYNLTPRQMSEFQKNVGQKINFEYSTKMSTEAFNNKSIADKVKALKKIMDKIYNEEKEKMVNGGIK